MQTVNCDNNKNHAVTSSYPRGCHPIRTVTPVGCSFWMALVKIHCLVAPVGNHMRNATSDNTSLLPPSQGNKYASENSCFELILST